MAGTRGKNVRASLIAAARTEFSQQGYAGARTREIARLAATSEVMLFRHFGSKANLFKETVFEPINACLKDFIAGELVASNVTQMSPTHFVAYNARLYAVLEENAPLLSALIAAGEYEGADILDIGDLTSLDAFFDTAEQELRRLADPASLELLHDTKVVVRFVFCTYLSIALFRKWLFPDKIGGIEHVLKVVNGMLVRGYGMDSRSVDAQGMPRGDVAPEE